MPVIRCLPGSNWPFLNEYFSAVESDHDYPDVTQIPKAQVHIEAKHLVDQSIQTETLGELTDNQEQDDSGGKQKSSSNQPSKTQSSKQNKSSNRNEKGYESGSSEGDQTNDNNGDDGDDENNDRRRRGGYEASDETSDDDEVDEDTEDDDDEPTPPPSSRKRMTRAEEESRRYKSLKRRQGDQNDDESEPMRKRSRPEKNIIHEYYREIGRSGKDEFRMEDLFDDYEIKVIHDFLSEIGKMRSRRRQSSQKREGGDGRRTSGKQKSSSSRSGGSRLERKHSDIYDSFSKEDQALIHNYYQQIGHKGGKYRGSDVDEDELDEEDRKVHPGFLKEKRKRQQNVVHEFLSKVAKQKRWGQAPPSKQQSRTVKRDKTGKMRSGGSREM